MTKIVRPSALVQFSIDLSVIKIIHEKKKGKETHERDRRTFFYEEILSEVMRSVGHLSVIYCSIFL